MTFTLLMHCRRRQTVGSSQLVKNAIQVKIRWNTIQLCPVNAI